MNEQQNRGELNFERWKLVVGLSSEFPKLQYIEDEDIDQKVFIRPEKIDQILLKLPNPLTAVIVQKGHGATTLCRYVFRETLKYSVISRTIPISVNLKPVWEDAGVFIDLKDVLKRGILYHLMSQPWEQALKESDYYNLIGAFDRGLGRPSTGALQNFKTEITRHLEPNVQQVDWNTVHELCPKYKVPITELLGNLSKCSIKPILFFDIPYQIDKEFKTQLDEDEILGYFYGYIKDFHGDYRPKKELLSEVYFLTQEAFQTIQSPAVFPREFDIIKYEPYAPVEAFPILERHHAPKMIGSPGVSRLDGVLTGQFLQLAYLPRDEQKTLVEIIETMKKEILARLDIPWTDVPAGNLDISPEQRKRLIRGSL